MKHSKLAAVFFVAALVLGYRLSTDSWGGMLFVYLGEERSPAALQPLKDFSQLDAKSLSRAAHDQVIANAEILKKNDLIGVRLGHFLTRTSQGKREFACQVDHRSGAYDKVAMTFVGLGVADQGEVPKITVEAPCRSSGRLDWLETVWIPMGEIAKLPGAESGISGFSSDEQSVQVENLPSEWPETWVLTNVRLFQSNNPDESLIIDTALIKAEAKARFTFDWKSPAQQKFEP